jgi:hypothetical protein
MARISELKVGCWAAHSARFANICSQTPFSFSSVVSGHGVQLLVEPTGKEFSRKAVSGRELAIRRNPDAPHRTLLLPE